MARERPRRTLPHRIAAVAHECAADRPPSQSHPSGRETRRFEASLAGPRILHAFAEAYPRAFFVEVGANDGEQHDHLRPILDAKSWRGIMIEPVPFVFERLRTNYRELPQVALENVAIADRDGHLPFYHLRKVEDHVAAGLPRWYDDFGSFSKAAVLNHASLLPDLEERLTCVNIPCLTFESLCRKHGVDRIDLLLVDTEEYHHEILRNVDWTVHRPRLVIYEHYHLSTDDRSQLRADLGELGYELKEEGFDTWCLQTRVEDELTRTFRALSPGIPSASVYQDR